MPEVMRAKRERGCVSEIMSRRLCKLRCTSVLSSPSVMWPYRAPAWLGALLCTPLPNLHMPDVHARLWLIDVADWNATRPEQQ